MYQQIAEDLREQIESGALEPGAQLPTELHLRERYAASRNTIRDAIKRLTARAWWRPGQARAPLYQEDRPVRHGAHHRTRARRRRGRLLPVRGEHRPPDPASPCPRLRSSTVRRGQRPAPGPGGTQVVSRHQERYIDEIPWSLQTSFYPMEFITRAPPGCSWRRTSKEGAVRYLRETIGIKQVGYRDWITARGPDSDEQRFFGIPHDCDGFRDLPDRLRPAGTPLRVTVTVFPADRNQFIVNVGNVPDPQYDQAEADAD